jgi:hypothetical protein
MRPLALLALLALASCGADGAPEPKAKPANSGVQVGVEVGIGVTGTL